MELFEEYFQQKEFSPIKVNVPNLVIYLAQGEMKKYVILLFSLREGTEWNKEQCTHVENQILQQLQLKLGEQPELLSFLCTCQVERVREIYRENNHTAVIDLQSNQLLLFEGMSEDPLGIYEGMESILQKRSLREEINTDTTWTEASSASGLNKGKQQIASNLKQVGVVNSCIILINILVFLITSLTSYETEMIEHGKLFWFAVVEQHEYYRLLTSMFLHGGMSHIFNNMLILAGIGGILEKRIGKLRYAILYLFSGVIAGIVSISYNMGKDSVGSIGASGAIFGIVGAVLWIILINKGRVENLSQRQMILFVFFSLYGGFTSQGVDNAAHVGGLIGGFILGMIIYRRPKKRGVNT